MYKFTTVERDENRFPVVRCVAPGSTRWAAATQLFGLAEGGRAPQDGGATCDSCVGQRVSRHDCRCEWEARRLADEMQRAGAALPEVFAGKMERN